MKNTLLYDILFPDGYDDENASFPFKQKQNPSNKHFHLQTNEIMKRANEIERVVVQRVHEEDCSADEMYHLLTTETRLLMYLLGVTMKLLQQRQDDEL